MYLGRVHNVGGEIEVTGCSVPGKGLLDWCSSDVIYWSCGRLERANGLGTHGGAGGDFGSVIVRVKSRR